MKRKIEAFKSLFLTYSRSSVLNWLMFLMLIIGIIFNLYSMTTYKILSVLFMLEILIINANTYKLEDIIVKTKDDSDQQPAESPLTSDRKDTANE